MWTDGLFFNGTCKSVLQSLRNVLYDTVNCLFVHSTDSSLLKFERKDKKDETDGGMNAASTLKPSYCSLGGRYIQISVHYESSWRWSSCSGEVVRTKLLFHLVLIALVGDNEGDYNDEAPSVLLRYFAVLIRGAVCATLASTPSAFINEVTDAAHTQTCLLSNTGMAQEVFVKWMAVWSQ